MQIDKNSPPNSKPNPKDKKTRSEPPDKDDPYKQDLLEEKLVKKYESLLKNTEENNKDIDIQQLLTPETNPQDIKPLPSTENKQLLNFLKEIDPDMEEGLLQEIMKEANGVHKEI